MNFFKAHVCKAYLYYFFINGKRFVYTAKVPDPLMAAYSIKTMSKLRGYYKSEKVTPFTWLKVKLMVRFKVAELIKYKG